MGEPRKIQQPRAGTNGFDPDVLHALVDRIEGVVEDLLSERGSYMSKCRSMREDIANIYDEAKARGIPTKPLKKAVKARELTRKIEALRVDFDLIERETYDQIRHALGDLADTPLGEAAAKGSPGAPDDEPDVRPGFLKDKDAEASAANAEALKGIKPLKSKGPKVGGDVEGSYKAVN